MASGMTKRAPLTLLLIAFAGSAPNLAYAQSTSSAESTLWGSMMKTLGVGGQNNIEYHDRPGLVVPPTRDLPPPGSARAAPAAPADPKSADAGKQAARVGELGRIPLETGA